MKRRHSLRSSTARVGNALTQTFRCRASVKQPRPRSAHSAPAEHLPSSAQIQGVYAFETGHYELHFDPIELVTILFLVRPAV